MVSKKNKIEVEVVPLRMASEANIEEWYVAALLLFADEAEIEVPEAHKQVEELLESIELDVTRTDDYLSDVSRSLH
jgi:tRNA(Met) C34 N-acetyltransferase TmcA